MERTHITRFYEAMSWSAVFAGLVTALSVAITFSFLVMALGLWQVDLYSSSPFSGVFTSMGLGSAIVLVLGLAAGGFVAGRLAGRAGVIHGFLAWALFMLIVTIQTSMLLSSAAHLGAKTVSSAASAAGSAVSGLAGTAGDALSTLGESAAQIFRDRDGNAIDLDKLRGDLRNALAQSDSPALNPDYLQQQYNWAKDEITDAAKAMANEPSNYQTILKNLAQKLKNRASIVSKNIDRDDVINGLVNNGMDRAQAEKTADRAINLYQSADKNIKYALNQFSDKTDQLAAGIHNAAESARDTADQAVSTASSISWWGFIASLIGALVSTIAGYFGQESRRQVSTLA
ncbi:DUF3792 domain-containing protein [Bartonella sp. DGB2]|uniref:DUF3792 domain-containing protein n=1 Tax=Bartonella sp. DGB2 TaxID=3388426 RepID=UPI00398FDD6E